MCVRALLDQIACAMIIRLGSRVHMDAALCIASQGTPTPALQEVDCELGQRRHQQRPRG